MVHRYPEGRPTSLRSVVSTVGLLLLCCSICISPGQCLPKVFRSNDICSVYNGHRVYFELGDRGQLQATNVTIPYVPRTASANQTTPNVCTLELVTCPSCNFKISLSYSNFPAKCAVHNEPPCRCDYLEFTEPPFESMEYTGRRNCGHDVVYQTQTRSVLIKFVYWSNHSHAFTLDYVAERNRETIQANPGPAPNLTSINNFLHHRIIATPYFPSYYPRDFGKEYVLSCNVEACRINVLFSDFQLAKTSTMEFYDWNGQRLGAVSGALFRPPVIQSTGPSMIIRFYANGGSGLGYRALVSFLKIASSTEESLHPNTNCGGVVENIGGAITMMKMLDGTNDTRVFDCVWLIKPPNTYAHLKTHLSLKVDTFEKLGPHSILTIIQGTTSDGTVLSVTKNDVGLAKKDLVVPLTSGFYVHLRATFGHLSRLALVYSGFSYLDCYMGTEFLCQNRKCIPIQLHCDGFDHCGDESDEPESCVQEWAGEPIDRRWYSHTPNYYFPKMDRYPDLRTATIIFIASSLGLIMLISALIVLLYRTGSRARHQRELQSQLQTISELLDSNSTHGPEELDDPPMYEAPPDYDEIIKVGMDEEMNRKRRRRSSSASGRRSRMRRSRRPSNTSEVHNPILEVQLPPETDGVPSTSGYTLERGGGFVECDHYDSDAFERYSDADVDSEDHNLRLANWGHTADRGDFLVSSRVLETPASAAGPRQGVGAPNSSPPPTYDQSNARFFASSSAAQQSISVANGAARSLTEDAGPITLGINFLPSGTVALPSCSVNVTRRPMDSSISTSASHTIPMPTTINQQPVMSERTVGNNSEGSGHAVTSATTMLPAITWNESTQTDSTWPVFGGSSDESRLLQQPIPVTSTTQTAFNSLDLDPIQGIDTYLLGFGHGASEEHGVSSVSSQETISSNRTSMTQLTVSTAATFAQPSVCVCRSLLQQALTHTQSSAMTSAPTPSVASLEMIRKHCPACRGQPLGGSALFVQSTIPPTKLEPTNCAHCNGRIVRLEFLQATRPNPSEPSGEPRANDQPIPTISAVCTCFGKFASSQGNITRTTSTVGTTLLATRTFSVDRLDDGGFSGGSYSNDRRSARSSTSAVDRFDAYTNGNYSATNNNRRNEC